ncbi:hypothetical protein DTO166G4_155 [Paecilomyces variotii]|nr:hypothetical protein DTO164E3_7940 [Paecilomyces variotii]KAJ9218289.1 hypothetical protein DTO166G4_155 [Paecilomyces variotii]KAJ9230956.1 hypothetical protein DTO166G5_7000 [Paecilomyces variotii]KAJ9263375.1 hypothetical protein DTO195F2_3031 [Paecilomyces variotii]KAJ9285200.1 hypothetical protein DTO021C3_7243 [Paecilomyces variotii]
MVEKGVIRGRVRGHGAPGLSLHAPRRKLRIIQGAEAKVFDVNLVCASSRIADAVAGRRTAAYFSSLQVTLVLGLHGSPELLADGHWLGATDTCWITRAAKLSIYRSANFWARKAATT